MNIKKLIVKLHPLEVKTIPYLKDSILFRDLVDKTGMKDVEVMRALQWLENKKALKIEKSSERFIILGENGLKALKAGLPERRLLIALTKKGLSLMDAAKAAKLDKNELYAAVGILKKKNFIAIKKNEKGIHLTITSQGKEVLNKKSLEERFIEKIGKNKRVLINRIKPEEKYAIDALIKRKGMIEIVGVKKAKIVLTALGKALAKTKISRMNDALTSEDLKTGAWKKKRYREYDTSVNVPEVYGGKKHLITEGIEYIKKIWLEMGFEEMSGPIVQSSFWCMDALFVPQDHPARDMQDTFFLKTPETSKIKEKEILEKVKAMHEHGGEIESKGWRYKFSEDEAKKNLLRTHTTGLSAMTLAKGCNIPGRYFSVNTVFRNEALDWKHLFEFMQVEGIVVDKNANFNNLIGYLKEFFGKMGYDKIRITPAHFPYTEPSVEVGVYDKKKKEWIELGGAGMFRPEVVIPILGKDVPVLAWGLGLERILTDYYKINDLRDFYKNDLAFLKKRRAFIR